MSALKYLAITIFIFTFSIQMKAQAIRELTAQEQGIRIEIKVANGYEKGAKNSFKLKENISVLISMTNTTTETFYAAVSNPFYQNRPELLKNGVLLPYRADVSERLKRMEDEECVIFRNISVDIEPNKNKRVDYFNLDDWYEPLEPGTYQLKLRRIFTSCRGPMKESDIVELHVLP